MRKILALAAAAFLGTGCSGTSSGGGAGEVSFLIFGDPEELAAYREVVAAYGEVEPGAAVRLVEASDRDDLIARLSTSFAAGNPPDLFLVNYRFYGQFASKDVLEPIEPYLRTSEAFSEEDFFEAPMDAFRWDGELTCLPQNVSSLVVYYNRDLFREAGVAEPASGWTWDEFVDAAVSLTLDEDGDGFAERYGVGVEPSIIRVAPFVWSNGGEVVDDEESPTRFTLDTPEALEAMERFFDLGRLGVMAPEEEVEAIDDETRFLNGDAAMVLSSRRSTPTFRTITGFEWDVAPLPVMGEPAGILHADAYCMTKASPDKQAGWRFMEFALGPEGQRITAASGRTVPSLRAVAESGAFLDPSASPARSRVFLDTIPVIRRVPSISTWPEIEDAVGPILEEGLFEGRSPERVAQQITEATTDLFARAEP